MLLRAANAPRGWHIPTAVERGGEQIAAWCAHQRTTARQIIAERTDSLCYAQGYTHEIVQRRRSVFGESKILTNTTEIKSRLCRGPKIIKPDVFVWFRVTQLNVRVEINVVSAPHLPNIVDFKLR